MKYTFQLYSSQIAMPSDTDGPYNSLHHMRLRLSNSACTGAKLIWAVAFQSRSWNVPWSQRQIIHDINNNYIPHALLQPISWLEQYVISLVNIAPRTIGHVVFACDASHEMHQMRCITWDASHDMHRMSIVSFNQSRVIFITCSSSTLL